MSILIDTGVLYADHDTAASRHDVSGTALEAVFDEALTLTQRGAGAFEPAKQLGDKIRGVESYPSVCEILWVSPAVFSDAVAGFEQYDDQGLSFTDATTVALINRHDIDSVLSFDDDFDGVISRTPPESVS